MGWTNFPVAAGDNLSGWDLYIELTRALRERAWAMGEEFFPHGSNVWLTEARPTSYADAAQYTGILTAVAASGSDYVLTDSGRTFISGFVDTGLNPHAPNLWDVVVEYSELDPWGVVRTQVLSNVDGTDSFTVAGGPLDDAVVAGQIPSVASLNDKRYCLVRRHGGSWPSLHWNDRWLPWPNARGHASGVVTASTTTTLSDTTPGEARDRPWRVDEHAGREVMTLAGGRLVRIPITGNTSDTLSFDAVATAPDVGADYAIIDADGRWAYGRRKPAPWRWYGGYDSPTAQALVDPRFYSHFPDGTLQLARTAAVSITLNTMNDEGTLCEERERDIFDIDLWTDLEDECTAEDRPHAPEFYWALRGLQVTAEGFSPGFVEATDHDDIYPDPDPLKAVPNFVPATWYKAAGINHYVTTVSTADVSGTAHITFPAITLPDGVIEGEVLPLAVHYAILDNGVPIEWGYSFQEGLSAGVYNALLGTLVSTSRIDLRGPTVGESAVIPSPYPPDQDWADTWVGKTLVISLRWSRYRPREFRYFYDRVVCVDDGVATSQYVTRAKSTRYVETSELGLSVDTDTPEFVDGDAARYVGDSWDDPTTTDSAEGGLLAETETRDRFFTGRRPRESGRATAGDTWYLQNADRSRLNKWWTEGVLRTESGTATGGTTTSLIDTTQSGSDYWDGTAGRYAGFVVEVLIGDTWHRRPVATFTAGTQTLTWSQPLPASAAGLPYRIREPAELNRWKGRSMRLWVGGEQYTRAITHSDDDTLYFATIGVVIPAGTAYEIIEAQPDEVWQWEAGDSAWITPTGDRNGTPWKPDKRENLPTLVRRFGRIRRGDYITPTLLNQLYSGIDVLRWTRGDASWTMDPAETGNVNISSEIVRAVATSFADIKSDAEADFQDNVDTDSLVSSALVLPNAYAWLSDSTLDRRGQIQAAHHFAKIDNAPTTRIKHAADAYIFADTDTDRNGIDVRGITISFDDQGYNVFEDKWSKVAENGPSFDTSEYIKVGDGRSLPPHWPPSPGSPGSGNYGWTAIGTPIVVLRWDVTGGLTYVS